MNREEFEEVVGDIASYFGQKTFQPRMSTLLWKILSPLSKGEGQRVVEQLVETQARAPTPAMVRQIALPYSRRADEERKRVAITKLEPCSVCGGSGMMEALLKENPTYTFSFACGYCDAAQVRGYVRLPLWTEAQKATYVPVSLRPSSYQAAAELRTHEFAKRYPHQARKLRAQQETQQRRGQPECETHPRPGHGAQETQGPSETPPLPEKSSALPGDALETLWDPAEPAEQDSAW